MKKIVRKNTVVIMAIAIFAASIFVSCGFSSMTYDDAYNFGYYSGKAIFGN